MEDCPFRYQGQYEDAETGMYYNRFRYYSADGGIYISQDPVRFKGGDRFYSYVHDTNTWVDVRGLWGDGFMNGASAKITAGNNSQVFNSSPSGHAEINGLNSFADTGKLAGQDVIISDVVGDFNPGGTKPVGVCTNCRSNMFDVLQKGGANSVTIPVTKSNQVTGHITIQSDKFGIAQAEIDAIRKGSGNNKSKSDAAWGVLKKHGTCS